MAQRNSPGGTYCIVLALIVGCSPWMAAAWSNSSVSPDEVQALAEFLGALPTSQQPATWDLGAPSLICSSWAGITCRPLRSNKSVSVISSLDLSRVPLHGRISPSVGALTHLQLLNLSGCSLTGPIPETLANCSSLAYLSLSLNYLLGSIPAALARLRSLQVLDLSTNYLAGPIPDSFGVLISLTILELSHNDLTGSIPRALGDCRNLSKLSLAHNHLNGTIPARLQELVQLHELDLSYNNLWGAIPSSFSRLTQLTHINLSFNQLEGPIPPITSLRADSVVGNPALEGVHVGVNSIVERGTADSRTRKLAIAGGTIALLLAAALLGWLVKYLLSRPPSRNVAPPAFQPPAYIRMSAKELLQLTGGFDKSKVIGRGAFSKVYAATLADGTQVAVKRLINKYTHQDVGLPQSTSRASYSNKAFLTELEVLSKIRHRNLVRLLGFTGGSSGAKALLLELVAGGNLRDHLHRIRPSRLKDWSTRLRVAVGVARALAYLHHDLRECAVVHCDVKPSNILLVPSSMEAKLSDLGIARIILSSNGKRDAATQTFVRGSIGYIAPEFAFTGKLTPQADVFSYGVVLLEIMTGRRPTDDFIQATKLEGTLKGWVQEALSSGKLDSILDPMLDVVSNPILSYEAKKFACIALQCTNELPSKRPTMREVVLALETLLDVHL